MKQNNRYVRVGGGKIPEREKWVYYNTKVKKAVLKGLDDSAQGKVTERDIKPE